MVKSDLMKLLKERGMSQMIVKDIFLYYLNTEDRQQQMLEWLKEHIDECNEEVILNEAQKILAEFLAKNPYNKVSMDMALPKWTPPVSQPPKPKELNAEKPQIEAPKPIENDPFDKVLQAFFGKMEDLI